MGFVFGNMSLFKYLSCSFNFCSDLKVPDFQVLNLFVTWPILIFLFTLHSSLHQGKLIKLLLFV